MRKESRRLRALRRELHEAYGSAGDSVGCSAGDRIGASAPADDHAEAAPSDRLYHAVDLSCEVGWVPAAHHLWLAAARLRLHLLDWANPGTGQTSDHQTFGDAGAVRRLLCDPAMPARMQDAYGLARIELGLDDATQVSTRLDALAREMAFIEALRERLLGRMQALVQRLAHAGPGAGHCHLAGMAMMPQVGRLSATALRLIRERFDEIDAQGREVMAALRHADRHLRSVRSHRDSLTRLFCGWETILPEWDLCDGAGCPDTERDRLQGLLVRTHHLLSPGHLPAMAGRMPLPH